MPVFGRTPTDSTISKKEAEERVTQSRIETLFQTIGDLSCMMRCQHQAANSAV